MKTLLVVTHVDFWRRGAGHRSRISSLLHYLKDRLVITVAYAGVYSPDDDQILAEEFPGVQVVALEPDRTINYKQHGELFEAFIAGKSFDAVLVEYIEMSFVLPMLHADTLTILDTHDLVADRIRSFNEHGLHYNGISMSDDEELSIFNCFDKVMLIQEEDHRKIGDQIGFERTLLVPHAPNIRQRKLRKEIKHIGFIGSEYEPNADAVIWFLLNVWPALDSNLVLNVYGNVVHTLPEHLSNDRVLFHGFVDDIEAVYNQCDIMINPVMAGAGLKIKNIEAMSNGVPLITTSHGAIGINGGSFLIANSSDEFISAIRILRDYNHRKRLIEESYSFVRERFSPNACYGELADLINQYQLAE